MSALPPKADMCDPTSIHPLCASRDLMHPAGAVRAPACLIIACSTAHTLSNKIIQKGLAFSRDWSGSVVNSER
jgi:hypothetical protein